MFKLVNLTTDKNCKTELYKYSWEPHNRGYFPRSHNRNLYIKTQGYTVEFDGGGIFKRHLVTCHVLHVFCLIAIVGVNNLTYYKHSCMKNMGSLFSISELIILSNPLFYRVVGKFKLTKSSNSVMFTLNSDINTISSGTCRVCQCLCHIPFSKTT